MKQPILKFILLLCFGLCAKLNFGYCQTPIFNSITVSNLTANGTQAKRYKIAEVGYNSHHWQEGGTIQIELFHKYFGVGYDKYYVEIGYSQGTDATLPVLRHVEGTGFYHTAKVSLGTPAGMEISYAGYPNIILPIYVDVRYYSNYVAKITFIRNRVTTFDGVNQIKINENPPVEDIIDFEVPIGAKSLYIAESGNVGIGTQSPWTKLDVVGKIGIRAADGGYRSEILNENSSAATAQAFSFLNAGGLNLLSLNYNGNVGIGTFTPTSKLDVRGNLFVGESVDGGRFTIRNLQGNIFKNDFLIAGKTNYTYLGNYQNFPLGIYTNNTERIRVSENGNIGIGTINPLYPLHIYGGSAMPTGWNKTLTLQSTYPVILFNSNNQKWAGMGYDFSDGGMRFWVNKSSDDLNGSSPTLTLLNNGKVWINEKLGIGTVTPNANLEVVRNFRISSNTSGYGYEFFRSDDDTQMDLRYMASNSIHRQIMTFTYNGDIGIGTTTIPSNYKLAVAGNVIADKVKVKKSTNGVWPDFVFAPTYKLPSLNEVEIFVKQNNHLPEIPSATEIEKDGQDLGEMNRLLLKKVEELTLYIINQEKRIQELEKKSKSHN